MDSPFLYSLNEQHQAYFLSPDSDIIPVFLTHISKVIENPSRFGLTHRYIINSYKYFNETMQNEGYAREKILFKILKNGWVRIRYYPRNDCFVFQIFKYSVKTKLNILYFLYQIKSLNTGYNNKNSDVKIIDTKGNTLLFKSITDTIDVLEWDENKRIPVKNRFEHVMRRLKYKESV